MSKSTISTSPYARIRHLTPNPRLHLRFRARSPSPSPTQPPPAYPLPPTLRPRSFSTTTHLRSNWAGRPPKENAGTDEPTEKHNVQHDQSQTSKKEKAKGTSDSAGLNGEAGLESKKGKEKVEEEFPAAAKLGPIIGMEDERGGTTGKTTGASVMS
ncbi:hypothetical protein SBOR_7341 [Sclerotinia borealis F-4128]|uniref:Uncharacterized protein n=1 Tax=Sclerotinia borealis (strain F-4128) TaxID=1432307 RepID=W9C8U4_SCLBF|nr:hypothetical protein SBOR_7341 [Sclerotinia borealis F-4128]